MELKTEAKKILAGMKTYFSNVQWGNLFSFLFFLALAITFWLTLFFKRNVEGTCKIPIKYTNIPVNVVFDTPPPQFVEAHIVDKGLVIFRQRFTRIDSLEINVTQNHEDNIDVVQGNQFFQLIKSRFSSNTQILGYFPQSISLATSKLESKELRVVFDGEINTGRANLVPDSVSFLPETVVAYGAQKHLAEMTSVKTEYTVFNNLKATSQRPIKLKHSDGIKLVPDEVDIYIPIDEFTERSVEIPITVKNIPKNMNARFFPSRVTVLFSVTLEEYKKISEDDFEVQLNYNKFYKNQDGRVNPEITKYPATVRNARLSPTTVEFLFEHDE